MKPAYCELCHLILKSMNACPRPNLLFDGTFSEAVIEIIMVIASFAAYFLFIITLFVSISRKTSRGLCIFLVLLVQHCFCEILKGIEAQSRPEGSCSDSYGFPANNASFVSALSTWLLLEWIILDSSAPFKFTKNYKFLRNYFLFFAPLVPVSGYYLNYHSLEQVIYGVFIGGLLSSMAFAFMYYTVIDRFDYTESFLVVVWRTLEFRDNLTFKQRQVDRNTRAKLQKLQKDYETIHQMKMEMLKQKDELASRINALGGNAGNGTAAAQQNR